MAQTPLEAAVNPQFQQPEPQPAPPLPKGAPAPVEQPPVEQPAPAPVQPEPAPADPMRATWDQLAVSTPPPATAKLFRDITRQAVEMTDPVFLGFGPKKPVREIRPMRFVPRAYRGSWLGNVFSAAFEPDVEARELILPGEEPDIFVPVFDGDTEDDIRARALALRKKQASGLSALKYYGMKFLDGLLLNLHQAALPQWAPLEEKAREEGAAYRGFGLATELAGMSISPVAKALGLFAHKVVTPVAAQTGARVFEALTPEVREVLFRGLGKASRTLPVRGRLARLLNRSADLFEELGAYVGKDGTIVVTRELSAAEQAKLREAISYLSKASELAGPGRLNIRLAVGLGPTPYGRSLGWALGEAVTRGMQHSGAGMLIGGVAATGPAIAAVRRGELSPVEAFEEVAKAGLVTGGVGTIIGGGLALARPTEFPMGWYRLPRQRPLRGTAEAVPEKPPELPPGGESPTAAHVENPPEAPPPGASDLNRPVPGDSVLVARYAETGDARVAEFAEGLQAASRYWPVEEAAISPTAIMPAPKPGELDIYTPPPSPDIPPGAIRPAPKPGVLDIYVPPPPPDLSPTAIRRFPREKPRPEQPGVSPTAIRQFPRERPVPSPFYDRPPQGEISPYAIRKDPETAAKVRLTTGVAALAGRPLRGAARILGEGAERQPFEGKIPLSDLGLAVGRQSLVAWADDIASVAGHREVQLPDPPPTPPTTEEEITGTVLGAAKALRDAGHDVPPLPIFGDREVLLLDGNAALEHPEKLPEVLRGRPVPEIPVLRRIPIRVREPEEAAQVRRASGAVWGYDTAQPIPVGSITVPGEDRPIPVFQHDGRLYAVDAETGSLPDITTTPIDVAFGAGAQFAPLEESPLRYATDPGGRLYLAGVDEERAAPLREAIAQAMGADPPPARKLANTLDRLASDRPLLPGEAEAMRRALDELSRELSDEPEIADTEREIGEPLLVDEAHSDRLEAWMQVRALVDRAKKLLTARERLDVAASGPADGSPRRARGTMNVRNLLIDATFQLYSDPPVSTAFRELIQNSVGAVKRRFGDEVGDKGEIKLDVILPDRNSAGSTLAFTIEDNGDGMSPEIVEQAFLSLANPPQRSAQAKQVTPGGYGIGAKIVLATARVIVETCDGKTVTTLVSEPHEYTQDLSAEMVTRPATPEDKQGTRIHVEFPRMAQHLDKRQAGTELPWYIDMLSVAGRDAESAWSHAESGDPAQQRLIQTSLSERAQALVGQWIAAMAASMELGIPGSPRFSVRVTPTLDVARAVFGPSGLIETIRTLYPVGTEMTDQPSMPVTRGSLSIVTSLPAASLVRGLARLGLDPRAFLSLLHPNLWEKLDKIDAGKTNYWMQAGAELFYRTRRDPSFDPLSVPPPVELVKGVGMGLPSEIRDIISENGRHRVAVYYLGERKNGGPVRPLSGRVSNIVLHIYIRGVYQFTEFFHVPSDTGLFLDTGGSYFVDVDPGVSERKPGYPFHHSREKLAGRIAQALQEKIQLFVAKERLRQWKNATARVLAEPPLDPWKARKSGQAAPIMLTTGKISPELAREFAENPVLAEMYRRLRDLQAKAWEAFRAGAMNLIGLKYKVYIYNSDPKLCPFIGFELTPSAQDQSEKDQLTTNYEMPDIFGYTRRVTIDPSTGLTGDVMATWDEYLHDDARLQVLDEIKANGLVVGAWKPDRPTFITINPVSLFFHGGLLGGSFSLEKIDPANASVWERVFRMMAMTLFHEMGHGASLREHEKYAFMHTMQGITALAGPLLEAFVADMLSFVTSPANRPHVEHFLDVLKRIFKAYEQNEEPLLKALGGLFASRAGGTDEFQGHDRGGRPRGADAGPGEGIPADSGSAEGGGAARGGPGAGVPGGAGHGAVPPAGESPDVGNAPPVGYWPIRPGESTGKYLARWYAFSPPGVGDVPRRPIALFEEDVPARGQYHSAGGGAVLRGHAVDADFLVIEPRASRPRVPDFLEPYVEERYGGDVEAFLRDLRYPVDRANGLLRPAMADLVDWMDRHGGWLHWDGLEIRLPDSRSVRWLPDSSFFVPVYYGAKAPDRVLRDALASRSNRAFPTREERQRALDYVKRHDGPLAEILYQSRRSLLAEPGEETVRGMAQAVVLNPHKKWIKLGARGRSPDRAMTEEDVEWLVRKGVIHRPRPSEWQGRSLDRFLAQVPLREDIDGVVITSRNWRLARARTPDAFMPVVEAARAAEGQAAGPGDMPPWMFTWEDWQQLNPDATLEKHAQAVADALRQGMPVPVHVLKSYPGMWEIVGVRDPVQRAREWAIRGGPPPEMRREVKDPHDIALQWSEDGAALPRWMFELLSNAERTAWILNRIKRVAFRGKTRILRKARLVHALQRLGLPDENGKRRWPYDWTPEPRHMLLIDRALASALKRNKVLLTAAHKLRENMERIRKGTQKPGRARTLSLEEAAEIVRVWNEKGGSEEFVRALGPDVLYALYRQFGLLDKVDDPYAALPPVSFDPKENAELGEALLERINQHRRVIAPKAIEVAQKLDETIRDLHIAAANPTRTQGKDYSWWEIARLKLADLLAEARANLATIENIMLYTQRMETVVGPELQAPDPEALFRHLRSGALERNPWALWRAAAFGRVAWLSQVHQQVEDIFEAATQNHELDVLLWRMLNGDLTEDTLPRRRFKWKKKRGLLGGEEEREADIVEFYHRMRELLREIHRQWREAEAMEFEESRIAPALVEQWGLEFELQLRRARHEALVALEEAVSREAVDPEEAAAFLGWKTETDEGKAISISRKKVLNALAKRIETSAKKLEKFAEDVKKVRELVTRKRILRDKMRNGELGYIEEYAPHQEALTPERAKELAEEPSSVAFSNLREPPEIHFVFGEHRKGEVKHKLPSFSLIFTNYLSAASAAIWLKPMQVRSLRLAKQLPSPMAELFNMWLQRTMGITDLVERQLDNGYKEWLAKKNRPIDPLIKYLSSIDPAEDLRLGPARPTRHVFLTNIMRSLGAVLNPILVAALQPTQYALAGAQMSTDPKSALVAPALLAASAAVEVKQSAKDVLNWALEGLFGFRLTKKDVRRSLMMSSWDHFLEMYGQQVKRKQLSPSTPIKSLYTTFAGGVLYLAYLNDLFFKSATFRAYRWMAGLQGVPDETIRVGNLEMSARDYVAMYFTERVYPNYSPIGRPPAMSSTIGRNWGVLRTFAFAIRDILRADRQASRQSIDAVRRALSEQEDNPSESLVSRIGRALGLTDPTRYRRAPGGGLYRHPGPHPRPYEIPWVDKRSPQEQRLFTSAMDELQRLEEVLPGAGGRIARSLLNVDLGGNEEDLDRLPEEALRRWLSSHASDAEREAIGHFLALIAPLGEIGTPAAEDIGKFRFRRLARVPWVVLPALFLGNIIGMPNWLSVMIPSAVGNQVVTMKIFDAFYAWLTKRARALALGGTTPAERAQLDQAWADLVSQFFGGRLLRDWMIEKAKLERQIERGDVNAATRTLVGGDPLKDIKEGMNRR